MVWIILSWIYITVTSFLIGCLLTFLVRKIFKVQVKETLHFSIVCINGFLLSSFILSAWALFYRVDLLANIFLLFLALLSFFINKTEITGLLKVYLDSVKKTSKLILFFFFLFVLVMACISFMPSSHADDSGCFSPLIKWTQEYKAVPGIANLDARFGYNSTWFVLQAAYGFAFLKAGLFNDLNGLLFLIVFIYSLQAIDKLIKGESSFLNYLKSLFFLPVLFIYPGFSHDIMLYSIQFFTSPTYDIPVTFILWILFFLFLELKELKASLSGSIKPYLIILYSAYLITIKLNAVPVVIIAMFILIRLVKEKNFRNALKATGLCVLIAIPWVAKTVISCGYLIFPFAELDVLDVQWKLTARAVLYIENSVMIYAIDPSIFGSAKFANDQGFFSSPVGEWFPVWYGQQNYINTIIFFLMIVSGLAWIAIASIHFIKHKTGFLKKYTIEIIFALTILAGILLWFTKGPAFRYGYGYILFFCMLSLARVIWYFTKEFHSAYTGLIFLAYIFYALVYYGINMRDQVAQNFFKDAPPIISPEYTRHELGGGKFINVVKEPACGNAPLPSSAKYVYDFLRPVYRGRTIEEGFINQRPAKEFKIGK